jgi:iron complex transport system substrate-binding protein
LASGALLAFAACAPTPAPTGMDGATPTGPARRVVSLDFCADQFVLKLADRASIRAVSRDAVRPHSHMAEAARGLPRVRPTTEEVLALQPDLVVRSFGGGPDLEAALQRAGVRVHRIGWGDDFAAVRANVRGAADALGRRARGEALVADFDRRLAALPQGRGQPTLYVTPGGVTSGPGTMIDALLRAAGLANAQSRPGWNTIDLEALALRPPALAAVADFGDPTGDRNHWSPARHALMTRTLVTTPAARLSGASTACAGWFVADAAEALAAAAR